MPEEQQKKLISEMTTLECVSALDQMLGEVNMSRLAGKKLDAIFGRIVDVSRELDEEYPADE